MPHTIEQRVRRWSGSASEVIDYLGIYLFIQYLAENLFNAYIPTSGASFEFPIRLRNWLNNCEQEADQKTLLRLVPMLFFCGQEEFNALYRAALHGPIVKWLIDETDLNLRDNLSDGLRQAVQTTWFCGLTDSMPIADFYHTNRIEGRDHRADMRTLCDIGGDEIKDKIIDYLKSEGMERIVLLEDFMGSGSQVENTIKFAASLSSEFRILVVPLMVCTDGFRRGVEWERRFSNVQFSPVISVGRRVFIKPIKQKVELYAEFFEQIRELVVRLHEQVKGGKVPDRMVKLYGPFGFGNTGALIVNYSNCPDNTLPVIHHDSRTWKALFPRSSRI